MKIVLFEIKDIHKDYFSEHIKGHELIFCEGPINKDNSEEYKDCDIICTFIYSKLDKECLNKLQNIKMIATRSTGYDHIDTEECKKRGILVSNVPFYGENTVAEHAFSLILSLSRKVHKSYIRTLNGNFSIENLQGFDLREKTIGVVGVGHIGMHLIKIAKGFGMHVLAYDINHDTMLSEILHFKYTDIETLIKNSDIISLHLPSNEKTFHFIDAEKIWKMKKGAIIINTARGDIIDTDALFHALKEGHLSGAGLDVIEGEEFIKEEKQLLFDSNKESSANQEKLKQIYKDKAIFNMENVVFTPHNAFNSKEAVERILKTTIDNIHSFVFGNANNLV